MKHSFTSWSIFNQCPQRYWALYVGRTHTRKQSEASARGSDIHEKLQTWWQEGGVLPEQVHPSWHAWLEALRDRPLQAEVKLENDVALGYADLYAAGFILDYKTGRNKRHDLAPREQMQFYTWLAGQDCEAHLVWVEHDRSRAHLRLNISYTPRLDRLWRGRLEEMQSSSYETRQGWWCRWCEVAECPFSPGND